MPKKITAQIRGVRVEICGENVLAEVFGSRKMRTMEGSGWGQHFSAAFFGVLPHAAFTGKLQRAAQ